MTSGVPESTLSFAEIELAAVAFARKNGFAPQEDNIRDLVEHLGGGLDLVHGLDARAQDSGAMYAWRSGEFVIHLSPFTGVLRDNFTIAHELGHLQLHVPGFFAQNPDVEAVRVNRFGNDKPELQANRFAAALLMPATEFTAIGEQTGWNIPALSVHFSVSQPAAQYRADFLRRQ